MCLFLNAFLDVHIKCSVYHMAYVSLLHVVSQSKRSWDRAKVQSESWRYVLDGERKRQRWHWRRRQWGWIHQCRCIGYGLHIPSSRIVVVEECWARRRGSAFFLLSVRPSFRESRRKRLSRPKVGLALALLLPRLLSRTASAPSARSPVDKHLK